MICPVEEKEERVAAELQDVAAVPRGRVDQVGVRVADQRDQLLGAELALRAEPLRERREAGDIEPEQRALEHPGGRGTCRALPIGGEARQIGTEDCPGRRRRVLAGQFVVP
jgi:hypothetical protein